MNDPLNRCLNEIPLPEQLHRCCVQGINTAQQEMESTKMKSAHQNHTVKIRLPGRTLAAAAAVAVCTVALAGTALAGPLRGFFADVTRWDGAVTGTEYYAQNEELALSAAVQGRDLLVTVDVQLPGEAPYAYFEQLAAGEYRLMNAVGETVAEGTGSEAAAVNGGRVQLVLSGAAADLSAGQYTLQMEGFVGSAKADQPLPVLGDWQCVLTVE